MSNHRCLLIPVLAALIFAAEPTSAAVSLPGKLGRLVQTGNKFYGRGEFKHALTKYKEAAQIQPDNPRVVYNTAAALYRLNRLEDAKNGFEKAAAGAEDQLQQYCEYNAGTVALRAGNLEEAITHLKRALTLNPEDRRAKHNLEMALRAKQKQKKKQQKRKKQQKQKKQKKQKKDRRKQQDDKQQKQDDKRRDQQNKQQKDKNQQKKQKPKQNGRKRKQKQSAKQGQKKKRQLNRKQAAQLLQQLAQQDREMQKLIRRAPMTEQKPTEKDW